jgi:hypothetical protein
MDREGGRMSLLKKISKGIKHIQHGVAKGLAHGVKNITKGIVKGLDPAKLLPGVTKAFGNLFKKVGILDALPLFPLLPLPFSIPKALLGKLQNPAQFLKPLAGKFGQIHNHVQSFLQSGTPFQPAGMPHFDQWSSRAQDLLQSSDAGQRSAGQRILADTAALMQLLGQMLEAEDSIRRHGMTQLR